MMSSSSSSHRPRKKKKTAPSLPSTPRHNTVSIDPKSHAQIPAFPLVAFFWPARKSTSQWVILPLVLMAAGLFRWAVGFWGYSGLQKPPMHGDFEAQRHWMEITIHRPMFDWYFYDLEYWGLDYPPLTAYHSWLLGKIGSVVNPTWFALDSSRGFEDQLLKVYMRATVLVSEYLVYVPAAILFSRKLARLQGAAIWESSIATVAILMQPATILIDHAHFQYNTVMLGFVLAGMAAVLSDRLLWSCVFFVAALCFKQMALYYTPAIFFYLLGTCLLPEPRPLRFILISLTTLLTFILIFAPLLLSSLFSPFNLSSYPPPPLLKSLPFSLPDTSPFQPPLLLLTQSIHRIFPFARGIFEDKVANIWLAIHTIHKLHSYPTPLLQRLSLSATLIAILPSSMTISLFPRADLLPWALASSAWGFFLCSFQVHEKSVLLPLLPMTALLASSDGLATENRAWIGWANILATWTLFPLLQRDDVRVPYAVLVLLWSYLLGLPPTSFSLYTSRHSSLTLATRLLHLAFYAAMAAWHGLEAFVDPPKAKPDLWVVLNCLIGCAGFGVCWLWCSWQCILRSGVMEDYFGVRVRLGEKEKEAKAERGKGKETARNGKVKTRKAL